MKYKRLDELEMFELLQAAYPEKFAGEDDDTYEAAQIFADGLSGWEDISELLGRIVMLTMPMQSPLTNTWAHCLGKVVIHDGKANMIAAVQRKLDI